VRRKVKRGGGRKGKGEEGKGSRRAEKIRRGRGEVEK